MRWSKKTYSYNLNDRLLVRRFLWWPCSVELSTETRWLEWAVIELSVSSMSEDRTMVGWRRRRWATEEEWAQDQAERQQRIPHANT